MMLENRYHTNKEKLNDMHVYVQQMKSPQLNAPAIFQIIFK